MTVKKAVPLFSRIDKQLCRTRVGSSRGKDYRTAFVSGLDWIVRNGAAPPLFLHIGITVDSELCDKAGQYTKEATVGPETNVRQFLQYRTV